MDAFFRTDFSDSIASAQPAGSQANGPARQQISSCLLCSLALSPSTAALPPHFIYFLPWQHITAGSGSPTAAPCRFHGVQTTAIEIQLDLEHIFRDLAIGEETMPPDRGEQDMPSSSSEDGLESPAPALPTRGMGKSYAAVVAEPPPKSSGSEEGKAAGKSSFTGPVRGRKRARAKESRGSGRDGSEDTGGKAPVESVTPQKVGEKWTASEGGEEAKGTKQEQEKLVSGDFSHYRRLGLTILLYL